MITTTAFASFYLDVMGGYVGEQIAQTLMRDGMITFDNIDSKEDLLHFCSQLGTIVKHRDADENGLTRIVKRSDIQSVDGYKAFTDSYLTLHTDGSGLHEPATLIVLWCEQLAEEGGASLFVDGKQIYQLLANKYPNVLQQLKTPNTAIFAGSSKPLHSSVFSTLPDGNICIRFRYDSLGYYAASISGAISTFLELLDQYKITFALHKHQGYLVQNGRWLHGRTSFRGEREVYRALIRTEPTTYIGTHVRPGFSLDS